MYEPQSGRVMRVTTDLPGVQLYTGNFLAGHPGKGGKPVACRTGFCLETQYYPDTPNQPDFPSCVFRAGEAFDVSHAVYSAGQKRGPDAAVAF